MTFNDLERFEAFNKSIDEQQESPYGYTPTLEFVDDALNNLNILKSENLNNSQQLLIKVYDTLLDLIILNNNINYKYGRAETKAEQQAFIKQYKKYGDLNFLNRYKKAYPSLAFKQGNKPRIFFENSQLLLLNFYSEYRRLWITAKRRGVPDSEFKKLLSNYFVKF